VPIISWYPQLWDWAAADGGVLALTIAGLVSVFSLLVPATLLVWTVALAKLAGRGAAAGVRRGRDTRPDGRASTP
jgi:hypothetical protein